MTIIADQVFAPGERVVRGTSVAVKVVAAEGREGAIMIPGTMHSVQGRIEMRVDPETGIAAINLEPNTGTPANNYYQWITQVPGTPPVVRNFEAPDSPTSSTLTSGVTLPVDTIPVADASEFEAATPDMPGLVSIGGQIVLYTGKTGTTLTGATGGQGTFVLGTAVIQGYWVGHVLLDPPDDLPTLHSRQTTDAHDASAVSVASIAGLSADDVQEALAEHQGDISSLQSGVTGLGSDKIDKATLDAHSLLKADVDNVPTALAVPPSRVVGRAASGNITALTGAEVADLVPDGTYVLSDGTGEAARSTGLALWYESGWQLFMDQGDLATGVTDVDSIAMADFLHDDDDTMDMVACESLTGRLSFWLYESTTAPFYGVRRDMLAAGAIGPCKIEHVDVGNFTGTLDSLGRPVIEVMLLDQRQGDASPGVNNGRVILVVPDDPDDYLTTTWSWVALRSDRKWAQKGLVWDIDGDGRDEHLYTFEGHGNLATTGGLHWLDYNGSGDPLNPVNWTDHVARQHAGAWFIDLVRKTIPGQPRPGVLFSARTDHNGNTPVPGIYVLGQPADPTQEWPILYTIENEYRDWTHCAWGNYFPGSTAGLDAAYIDTAKGLTGGTWRRARWNGAGYDTPVDMGMPGGSTQVLWHLFSGRFTGRSMDDIFLATGKPAPIGGAAYTASEVNGEYVVSALFPLAYNHPYNSRQYFRDINGDGRVEVVIPDSGVDPNQDAIRYLSYRAFFPEPPTDEYLVVFQTAAQAFAGNATSTVVYQAIERVVGDISYDTLTGVFTINRAGRYRVAALHRWAAAATDASSAVFLVTGATGGTTLRTLAEGHRVGSMGAKSQGFALAGTSEILFAAGAQFRVRANITNAVDPQNGGTTVVNAADARSTRCEVSRVGPHPDFD